MSMKKKEKEVKKSKSVPADGSHEPSLATGKGVTKTGDDEDAPGRGDGQCPMTDQGRKLLQHATDFQRGSLESLDGDFYTYLGAAPVLIRTMRFSPMLEDRVRHWVRKLIAGNYPDYASKRKRNMYLSNLLIQVKNGDLKEPFTQEPPEILPSASGVFKLKPPPDDSRVKQAKDIMLIPKEYLHVSTQGRTYMATKILENNMGACAYIGVSVGGDEPRWITPSGEEKCLPERDDLNVKEIMTRGEQAMFVDVNPGKSIHSIASERKPQAERESLIEFYKYVLKKIEDAKEDENFEFDGPKDELLGQMMKMTRCEAESQGALSPAQCNNYKNILAILEQRIRGMLSQAIRRNQEIQQISVQANVIDTDPRLVDISSMRAFDPADDIWKTAVTAEPSEGVLKTLRMQYPACIITVLLMLLERQRQIIIDQEKKTHEHLVASMKTELLLDVKDAVVQYQEAQKKYTKAMKILKQAERARNEQESNFGYKKDSLEGGPLSTPMGGDEDNTQAKEALVHRQLMDAKRRLELARRTALDIDDKMDELTARITDTQARNEEANRMLKKDAVRWSQVICQMKADLKAQERQIMSLKRFIDAMGHKSQGCVY